ncbi:DBP [Bat adenovirus 2]|uniref:DNA-binding protein n=2 Tax=Mastadenovirus TaxID=10509 RepID=A0A894JCE0_9ADEN|nr:DBP [Bat adenovirus 2]AEM06277.1 DBP [Bat adenovirus 2]QRV11589.1 DNA-binding protein [Bat mastadenovirus]QRV11626.1 DNA-binding protein [Bat mastadenovirus]
MSHKKVISESSSEEEAAAAPPVVPPKKRQRKELRGYQAMAEVTKRANAALEAAGGPPGQLYMQTFCGQRVDCDADGKVTFTKVEKGRSPGAPSVLPPEGGLVEELVKRSVAVRSAVSSDYKWQQGMELALKILLAYQVDHKDLTLLPDSGTLECFKKAVQGYLTSTKTVITYNFTNQKTFQHVTGRLLLDFVLKAAGVNTGINPSGCVVWAHGCQKQLMCLHGSPMLQKEQLVEMDVNSENAQRVLKENPEKTKIVSNRWGRNVVQMRNEDAYCCAMDANMTGGNFSGNSCGMSYTDGPKALVAFQQIMAFQQACYPKMTTAGSHMLIPIKCECNWNNQLPLLGRQTCKITPFALPSTEHIDRSLVDDSKMLATLDHPAMLVFQCCNPVYRNSKASPQKNCDFKISAVDMVACVQIAKQIWNACIGTPPPLKFPEFKWSNEYKYQSTILPQAQHDDDASLF